MSTWTNEQIEKRIEDEDQSHDFGRGIVEPRLNVPHPTMPEQHPTGDIKSSKIQVISETYLSLLEII